MNAQLMKNKMINCLLIANSDSRTWLSSPAADSVEASAQNGLFISWTVRRLRAVRRGSHFESCFSLLRAQSWDVDPEAGLPGGITACWQCRTPQTFEGNWLEGPRGLGYRSSGLLCTWNCFAWQKQTFLSMYRTARFYCLWAQFMIITGIIYYCLSLQFTQQP